MGRHSVGIVFAALVITGTAIARNPPAAAPGLLYRAALDSAESNAVRVHPIFFAVDIGDLVEAYPLDEGRGTQVRRGASVGISVPLSAYLERP